MDALLPSSAAQSCTLCYSNLAALSAALNAPPFCAVGSLATFLHPLLFWTRLTCIGSFAGRRGHKTNQGIRLRSLHDARAGGQGVCGAGRIYFPRPLAARFARQGKDWPTTGTRGIDELQKEEAGPTQGQQPRRDQLEHSLYERT